MSIPQTAEHFAYHALVMRHQGNYRALRRLITEHQSWHNVLYVSDSGTKHRAESAWNELAARGIRLLLQTDPEFPPLLKEIPWAPMGLYARGGALDSEPTIAIVGTRRATQLGQEAARAFAEHFAGAGVTAASGLAFGIDGAAHSATVAAHGRGIGVLASGIDQITPRSNEQIGNDILRCGGTLISEYPPGSEPLAHRFLERNRIISGLSLGVVVIEAPQRSGTLATARFAVEQNRDVFVVPGAVNHPNYVGSHALIRSGAALVTKPHDVLEALGIVDKNTAGGLHAQQLPFLDTREQRIVELLREAASPLTADLIAERLALGANVINETIGSLLIAGVIVEDGPGYRLISTI